MGILVGPSVLGWVSANDRIDLLARLGISLLLFFFIGLGRYGYGIARTLRARGCRVQGVDYNPDLVHTGDAMGYTVLYGDAEDPEFISTLPLARIQWVVSTVHERHVNQALIHSLRNMGYAGRIAVTAHDAGEVAPLQQAGAELVLMPFQDAANEAADRLLGAVFPVVPQ